MQEQPKRQYGEFIPVERDLLTDAIYEVTKQLITDFPTMPDIIVPDTSGRIAELLFLPILQRVAAIKGVSIPKAYRFVTVSSQDSEFVNALETEREYGLSADEILRRQATPQRLIDPFFMGTLASLQYAQRERMLARKQAMDITKQREEEGRTSPLIIADTTVDKTTTWQEINRAFNTSEPFHLYVLYPHSGYYASRNPHVHAGSHRENFLDLVSYLLKDRETYLIRGARKTRRSWGTIIEDVKPINQTQERFLARIQQEILDIQSSVIQRLIAEGLLPSSSETEPS